MFYAICATLGFLLGFFVCFVLIGGAIIRRRNERMEAEARARQN